MTKTEHKQQSFGKERKESNKTQTKPVCEPTMQHHSLYYELKRKGQPTNENMQQDL